MYKNSAKQRASLTVRSQADYRLGTARKASERLVPLESWWLNPDTFYAKAKSERKRMTAISTNYRKPDQEMV